MSRAKFYPAIGASVPFPTATDPNLSTAGAEAELTSYLFAKLQAGQLLSYDPLSTTFAPQNVDHFYDVRFNLSLTSSRGEYDNQVISTVGSSSVGDGGEGYFFWASGSATTQDHINTYGTTAFGRWKRLQYSTARMCTDLSTSVGKFDGEVISLRGYRNHGDGGGGTFYWLSGSSQTADNGMIFGSTPFGRWRRDAMSASIDVKWFGARGIDNGTNDSTAIQAAIDYVSASAVASVGLVRGGEIHIPRGLYRVTTSLVLPRLNQQAIRIRGDGTDITVLQGVGLPATGAIIQFAQTPLGRHCDNYSFEDITLTRSDAGYAFHYNYMTDTTPDDRERLKNPTFRNMRFGGSCVLSGASGADIDHINFTGRSGLYGFDLLNSSRTTLFKCTHTSASDLQLGGIRIISGSDYVIRDCRIERCQTGGHAIHLKDTQRAVVENTSFEGGSEDTQLFVDNSQGTIIINGGFAQCDEVNSGTQAALKIGSGSYNTKVIGGSFKSFTNVGVGYAAIKVNDGARWVNFDTVNFNLEPETQIKVESTVDHISGSFLTADSSTVGAPIKRMYSFYSGAKA
jgi:hypothetical protein